jgi:hypothetical protein
MQIYYPRSHTKMQRSNCKPKITAGERAKRKRLKQLTTIFPKLQYSLCLPIMAKKKRTTYN